MWVETLTDSAHQFEVFIEARHGEITTGEITGLSPSHVLGGSYMHKVNDWRQYSEGPGGEWLNNMFGVQPETSKVS